MIFASRFALAFALALCCPFASSADPATEARFAIWLQELSLNVSRIDRLPLRAAFDELQTVGLALDGKYVQTLENRGAALEFVSLRSNHAAMGTALVKWAAPPSPVAIFGMAGSQSAEEFIRFVKSADHKTKAFSRWLRLARENAGRVDDGIWRFDIEENIYRALMELAKLPDPQPDGFSQEEYLATVSQILWRLLSREVEWSASEGTRFTLRKVATQFLQQFPETCETHLLQRKQLLLQHSLSTLR
jgi:hypothetical protein